MRWRGAWQNIYIHVQKINLQDFYIDDQSIAWDKDSRKSNAILFSLVLSLFTTNGRSLCGGPSIFGGGCYEE
jgi:hypothetical protein